KTFADQGPRESFFTQDLVLRIDEYNCSVFPMDFHGYLLFEFSGGRDQFESWPGLTGHGSMRQFPPTGLLYVSPHHEHLISLENPTHFSFVESTHDHLSASIYH